MDISKIDENLAVAKTVDERGLTFREATDPLFRLYGVFHDGERYRRMPKEVAEATSPQVAALSKNTSGGRVRFVTNSSRIAIKAVMPSVTRMAHMAFSGIHGFDMYSSDRFVKAFIPPTDITDGYESEYDFKERKSRLITLNMPLYNGLVSFEIGLDADASLAPAPDYTIEDPVVYYGSSITQGGCASRPGTAYPAILSRALDCNFINLGFSGSGCGESSVSEYIASLKMSAFVLDYDHNARSPEHLRQTHKPFFDTIRNAHPELPIIMMSRPKFYRSEPEDERFAVIRETYEAAVAAGDKNVYLIDGSTLMSDAIRNEGTVDDCHPTDLGFFSMAEKILPVLKKALTAAK